MPYCITWTGEGFIYLFNPYSEAFIKDMKSCIPEPYRRWDYVDRVWLIHERYRNEALYIASRHFKTKPVIEDTPYRRLLCNLDSDGLKAVWRQVALKLHPDTGGSHEAFIEAQVAYEKLTERRR